MGASFDYTVELENAKMRLQKLKEKLKLRAMLRRGEFSGQKDQDPSKVFHTLGGSEMTDAEQASPDLLPQLIARYLLGQEINLPLDSQALQNKVQQVNGRRSFKLLPFGKPIALVCSLLDTLWCLRLKRPCAVFSKNIADNVSSAL